MKNPNYKILLIPVFLFFGILTAQSLKAQSEFGIKGGILFSNIHKNGLNSNLDFEINEGFSVGAFYKKRTLFGPVGFQSEFLYQLKGANIFIEKYESSDLSTTSYEEYLAGINAPKSYYREEEILHYFSLPLLLTFKTTKFLDLYAGPEINYLLSKKTNRIESNKVNHFSAGFATGAILKLSENTSLDFRYSADFTPYDDMGSEQFPAKLKNNGFAITIQQTLFRK